MRSGTVDALNVECRQKLGYEMRVISKGDRAQYVWCFYSGQCFFRRVEATTSTLTLEEDADPVERTKNDLADSLAILVAGNLDKATWGGD